MIKRKAIKPEDPEDPKGDGSYLIFRIDDPSIVTDDPKETEYIRTTYKKLPDGNVELVEFSALLNKALDLQIPSGTYGQEGWCSLWAIGKYSGIRQVRLSFPIDKVLCTCCGVENEWYRAVIQHTQNKYIQYEFFPADASFYSAYRGLEEILRIVVYPDGGGWTIDQVNSGINIEHKNLNFC